MDYIIYDMGNLMWRIMGTTQGKGVQNDYVEDGNYGLWKNGFLTSMFKNILTVSPTKGIILAYDSKGNWRKDAFPSYKHRRKKKKKDSFKNLNIPEFLEKSNEFFDDLSAVLPQMITMRNPKIEADDYFGVLSKLIPDTILGITADSDMYQCKKNSNYSQSKTGSDLILIPNPKDYLFEKICRGDRGDDIPSIYPRLGKVTFKKMMDDGSLLDLIENDDKVRKLFERNRALIDFDYMPKWVSDFIKKKFYETKPVKNNEYEFYKFLVKHKMRVFENYYMRDVNFYFKKLWTEQEKSINNSLFK